MYNLSNDIDVEATKKKIENYRKDNKDQIIKNRSKVVSFHSCMYYMRGAEKLSA